MERGRKGISSASEPTLLLSTAIDGLGQEIEQEVGVLSGQLYPSALSEGLVPAFQSFAISLEQHWPLRSTWMKSL